MPRLPGGRTFWIIVLSLLAVNYLSVALFAPGKAKSVTIPYDAPTGPAGFVQQVTANNVTKIKTQGASVEGEFKNEVKFPDDKADAVKNFETELPSFVIYNNGDLNKLLTDHKVTTSATPINDGRGFLTNLILGFGPVILLVFLFVWLSRRAGGFPGSGPRGSGVRGRRSVGESAIRGLYLRSHKTKSTRLYSATALADVAQLARASACHAEGRGFESLHPL